MCLLLVARDLYTLLFLPTYLNNLSSHSLALQPMSLNLLLKHQTFNVLRNYLPLQSAR